VKAAVLPAIDPEGRSHLGPAMGADMGWCEAEAAAGRLTVLALYEGAERVGTCVFRIDRHADGFRELVLVGGGGKHPDGRGTAELTELLRAVARANGCARLRAHASAPGMFRVLHAAGWTEAERVFHAPVSSDAPAEAA
jgi:hypothetical protein